MATLVLTKDGIYVGDVCVAKYYPIAGLRSRFVSAVQQIPVAWKHLAKVGCLIVLAGSTYLGYKIYWHFCNRTSLNRHLQGSEWIELSKGSIIEVIEEPRLENNLPHNDALREEHPRIMKIARILVRTSMAGSQLNEDTPQINLQLIAIRRDVFSLLRAVLLQNVMCLNSLLQRIGGAQCLFQKFKTWSESNQNWLMHWQFHAINRFGMSSFHEILYSCLDALQSLEEKANMERHSFIILACAKRQLSFVAKLLEIMKLIMMASAIELFEQQDDLAIVPSFASVLFSRDQTCTPKYLMLNHFNPLGHTEERLEEIDFSLLGYSLRETVTIVRPYLYGTQDYVKHYPECMIGIWPEVVVFANKEGQYSIRGN